jgi:hypothetical protein
MSVVSRVRGPNRTYVETCDVCGDPYVAHQRGSHYCSKRCNMRAVQVLDRRVRPRLSHCSTCNRKLHQTPGSPWWSNHARDCSRRGLPPDTGGPSGATREIDQPKGTG